MLKILGIINILSQALQRKDQDIVNAMNLVKSTGATLQKMRDEGFDALMFDVTSLCEKNHIQVLEMGEVYVNPRNRRQSGTISNRHYYEFSCFNMILDMQNQEFRDRFSEASSELLICMTALNPRDSFCAFDSSKLRKLIDSYPYDFSYKDRMDILHELDVYPSHMQEDGKFANLKSISDLAKVMVETDVHLSFPLIYLLVKLSLILPVATATVERCFSAMKLVKSVLRNRISDEFLNDCVICAIEREAFSKITNEEIIKRFLLMCPRRFQL